MRTLRRVPLFFRVERDALVQICSSLRRSTFLPDEVICRQGEVVHELLLLESGVVICATYPPEEDDEDSEDVDEPVVSLRDLAPPPMVSRYLHASHAASSKRHPSTGQRHGRLRRWVRRRRHPKL